MDTLYDVGSPSSLRAAVSFVIRRRNWKKRSILFKPAVADHDLGVEVENGSWIDDGLISSPLCILKCYFSNCQICMQMNIP